MCAVELFAVSVLFRHYRRKSDGVSAGFRFAAKLVLSMRRIFNRISLRLMAVLPVGNLSGLPVMCVGFSAGVEFSFRLPKNNRYAGAIGDFNMRFYSTDFPD